MVKLLLLGLKINFFELVEFIRVLRRFGFHWQFLKGYLLLKLAYAFDSPYQVSRRFLIGRDCENIHVYGETPITLMQRIISELEVRSDEHIFELGSGSGFTSLWLNTVKNTKVTAIEQVPVFCRRLRSTSKRINAEGLRVAEGNYLLADFSRATLVYLYASDMSDQCIAALVGQLSSLPAGGRVITVSYSLVDYCLDRKGLKLQKQFTVTFPWGAAEVFIQVRTSDELMSVDSQSGCYSERPTQAQALEEIDKSPV